MSPQTAADATPASAAASGDHPWPSNEAITTVVRATTGADRKIDSARHDDHGHAKRGGRDNRGLPGEQLEVAREKEARADQDAEDHGDEEQPENRAARASQEARHQAALSEPVAASIKVCSVHS